MGAVLPCFDQVTAYKWPTLLIAVPRAEGARVGGADAKSRDREADSVCAVEGERERFFGVGV
jgi:hypothetical protein